MVNPLISRTFTTKSVRAFSTFAKNDKKPRFVPKKDQRYAPDRHMNQADVRPGWEKHHHDMGGINPMWKTLGTLIAGTAFTFGFYLVTQSMGRIR